MPGSHGSQGEIDPVDVLSIRIDGRALPDAMQAVEATITRELNELPEARVVLRSEFIPGSDIDGRDPCPPGAAIEITVLRSGTPLTLFRGVLTGKSLSLGEGRERLLTLACRHPLYVATLSPKVRIWRDASDADCIAQVLAAYGPVAAQRLGGVVHPVLWQGEVSDWAFARARAEANGWWLLATDDGVALREPGDAQAAAFALDPTESIHLFEGEWDVSDQPTGVQALAWNPESQSVEATPGVEPAAWPGRKGGYALAQVHGQAWQQRYAGEPGEAVLQALASASLRARRQSSPSGRVQCNGTPLAMPGAWMALTGVGEGFDGDVPVSGVTHRFKDKGWMTEVRFGASTPLESRVDPLPRADAWRELQTGIVEALEDDPRGEFRVRVRLPLAGAGDIGVHARLAVPDAGQGHGMVLLPDIGDEVVLSCIGGDPGQAVIIGSLYSSRSPPPLTPRDGNPVKGYVSRRGLKLLFDDASATLRLETRGGRTVVLSDDDATLRVEDPHGNRIVMDASGIAIESAHNLSLKAAGDLSLHGTSVKVGAAAELDLSSNAGTTVQAGSTLTLRGSIVTLN